jgi:poly-beta-hydroxybutyrate-responsive repressor
LLLLSEKPSHGYELVERLESDFGMSGVDPGGVYRNLKRLEDDGCLDSEWETGDTGPARKTYRVTPEGRELLDLWATTVSRNRRILDSFLTRYRNLAPARGRDVRDDG